MSDSDGHRDRCRRHCGCLVMRCAVACPGPSLSAVGELEGYEAVLAVNGAAQCVASTHWVFLDNGCWRKYKPIGQPVICTSRLVRVVLARRSPELNDWAFVDALFEDQRNTINRSIRWSCFSSPTALVVAQHLGATSIDVFGCDMQGTSDCFGSELDAIHRQPDRWKDELAIWEATANELRSVGIEVTRCQSTSRPMPLQ